MKVNTMKTNKTSVLITAALSLALLATVSCQRDAVHQPSPLGPSSIAVMLNLNACPNVILAGVNQRSSTSVTATLQRYDGTAQANQTVLFEVIDSQGNRLNLGFFDGSTSVISKPTDSSGNVSVNYFGPLADELTQDASILIRASVAWNGSQFINDTATLLVIRDMKQLSLDAKAMPETLYASGSNPSSIIQATVLSGGQPVRNFPVYFLLDHNLGAFADGKLSTYSNTNDQGVAMMTYVGPTADQMSYSSDTAKITVLLSEELYKELSILVIRQK
jgi:hypothetical protein